MVAGDGDAPPVAQLREVAGEVAGIVVVGGRRRSPRTALPGPFVVAADGRRVPVGWVPDHGPTALRRFAESAAAVHRRRLAGGGRSTVAVLAQRTRRYRDLAGRIARLLDESEAPVQPLRWTADDVPRDDLARGLGYGLSAALYVGHGRPVGWVGYRGTRGHHLADAAEPAGVVLSLTCLTASRRRVGVSFAEALVLGGAAAAAFGAVCSTDHRWNARWALRITRALADGCETAGELVISAEQNDPGVASYRILGDPTAPLLDAAGARPRAGALTREMRLAS